MGEELRLADDVHRLDRRGAGDRAAAVGAADAAEVRRVHDLGAAGDRADRHAGAERLRGDDQVGNDAVVLDREQAAGAAEAALHLVGDHDDAVRVAQLANAPEEARRHRDEAGLALHRLDDHRGDRRRIDLRDERVLELPDAEVDVLLLGHARRRAVEVRNRQPDDLRRERAEAALEQPVLAGQAQRQQRPAVIAALEADDRRAGPVYLRASLTAFSTLSAPLLARIVFF